jgi:DNA-binding transcriptional MerR regulator
MSKEKFNWKSLFVNEEGNTSESNTETTIKKEIQNTNVTSSTKFPDSKPINTINVDASAINNSVLDTIIDMYESGFESLNLPGYDFYEFFKAIKAVGSNDPAVYKMAMTMAQSVDSKVNKESLLDGASFYVKEINDVHQKYQTKGNTKRDEIQKGQQQQKKELTAEISSLEKQILELQTQISNKKNALSSIDNDLVSELSDIEQKIVANDIAKNKILETINTVVSGVQNNL